MFGVVKLMAAIDISLVLDVGANDGGYARAIRRLGYAGEISSFEPTKDAYARLVTASGQDPKWQCHRVALGDYDGAATIHIAGNSASSSSTLEMLPRHLEASPSSAYVASEEIAMSRLDSFSSAVVRASGRRVFLKMDVQGAEERVLDGADASLPSIVAIQAEMGLVPLYAGQPDYRVILDRIERAGFTLAGIVPGFSDPHTGQMLQMDGVFVREERLPNGPSTQGSSGGSR